MKIGIYTPHLNAYGGGEKYICKIAETLSEKHNVEFVVFEEPDTAELERRLNVNLSRVNIKKLNIPKLFNVRKLRALVKIKIISKVTKNYNLFLNQENHTVIPAYSQKNIYLCQVPPVSLNRISYKKWIKDFIFDHNLKTYSMIMVYSYFVKKCVLNYYPQKKIEVLYPPIDTEQFYPALKKKIILSVGRFFVGGHCKKQFEMIRTFKELYNENEVLKDWEYHLIGGVSANIKAQEYLKRCQEEARGYPVYFHINAKFQDLKELYGRAKIFWHATGLGEDENKHPERMEHFGITTGEAMSAGCVPVVINKGGQPEIVRNMVGGFLWNNTEELKKNTLEIIDNNNLWQKMSQSSIKRSQKFGIDKFRERVKQIINYI